MIVFDLQCGNGHVFEGWFKDRQAYQEQKEQSMISCPVCNDTSVSKILSSFAIRSSQEIRPTENRAELAELGKKIAEFMDKNFENVGSNFANEALKMHYGVSEPRSIRGTSSPEEEKTLEKEGINFFKVPVMVQREPDSES